MRWVSLKYSDIVVASPSIDLLNVIYRSYTLILLVHLAKIYVHSSPYTSLITRNALKQIITTVILSRNHQLRRRLPPSFMLMWHRFVRCNFIGHDGWNGQESTNQLRQHISHVNSCISCFIDYSYTISHGYYSVLVILNISLASLPIWILPDVLRTMVNYRLLFECIKIA